MAEYIPLPENIKGSPPYADVEREHFIEYAYRVDGNWTVKCNCVEMLNMLATAIVDPGSLSYQDHAVIEHLKAERDKIKAIGRQANG